MTGKQEMHQIGEVANRVGLSLRTVRYYEEAGLVRPSQRTDGGFRLYGQEEIERLQLVKQMKPLGFTLQEMGQLLKARDQLARGAPGDAAYERARERLSAFAASAKGKCEDLRSQLETAEDFAAELQRDLRRRATPTKTPA
jgi:MerR family copper efflux transcriptional regulator